jgi:hypothetical protein
LLILLTACSLALVYSGGETQAIATFEVEPFVWQLDKDYPEGSPSDQSLPIDTVYIKTHDATDWMSEFDKHPAAVNGPDAVRNLIGTYNQQGIDVAAWFVPKRLDIDGQVAMAEAVIDAGVTALYADLEPFAGFCNQDCGTLADTLWTRVRAERPNAKLGVIYDPRSWWWDGSATTRWLANADVALPMCYWDDFIGQVPYGDPQGCIAQAKFDLDTKLAPGRNLEYIPILHGESSPEKFQQAMDASARAEATSVSIWRRGVVSGGVWNGIASYVAPGGPHCALNLAEGCVVKEAFQPQTYIIEGGAKLPINPDTDLTQLGLTPRDVQTLPTGTLQTLPNLPNDGALFRDGSGQTFVVFGGAKFVMPDGDYAALGLSAGAVRTVPATALSQLPLAPPDYSRIQQLGDASGEYVALKGSRIPLDSEALDAMKAAGIENAPKYTLPTGAFSQVPLAQVKRGDSDCDGNIALIDVVRVLQKAIGVPSPGICLHVAGDVTCDGWAYPGDALLILRFVAGLPQPPSPCPKVGQPEPAAIPARNSAAAPTPIVTPPTSDAPAEAALPSVTPVESPPPSATPVETHRPTRTP